MDSKNLYDSLEDLALNLYSAWNHGADALWKHLDPELWGLTHNPWAVLQSVSREKLQNLLKDKKFAGLVHDLLQHREEVLTGPCWFSEHFKSSNLKTIAYFSMEFMLAEALPIYSGGLGNVAGDQLKAASDLGVPVIGIGLLYSQGYFRQFIDKDGHQQELFPYNDPGQLPVKPLRLPNGEWLRIKIELPGWPLWLRTWEVKVGRRTLYLLDSNDAANFPAHRGITSELYGGDSELRLKQELVLGICGWRLLNMLGIEPEICHLNEGHAAFAVLERARRFMEKTKEPFAVALEATKKGNLFTTHTAVSAGFDRFPIDLLAKYLQKYAETELKIPFEDLVKLGQNHEDNLFNMAFLAIRGSGYVNGVSQLHSKVSKHLFKNLFPRFPEEEIPVNYVTNGVHMPTWDSSLSDTLWTDACGKSPWQKDPEELEKKIRAVPDAKIWQMRNQSRALLVDEARQKLIKQFGARGSTPKEIEKVKSFLNPDVLTLGFARRFASYKRPDFLLYDQDRFIQLLTNRDRPIQLIIAGKAHPKDKIGHDLIEKWSHFIARSEIRPHVVFLSDYDMILTSHMVQGVDVWINTPRRPWEACGTSGMKILVNGGLNLSELDGWWAEAYKPEVGFAIGDGKEHDDDHNWDLTEANTLYDILEYQIIPEFYNRDARKIPVGWVSKIRESMATLTPHFAATRAVREYTEKFYLPATELYYKRAENDGSIAQEIVEWKEQISQNWDRIEFGELKITSDKQYHTFEVSVYLNNLSKDAIKVQLYSELFVTEMIYKQKLITGINTHLYTVKLPAKESPAKFTPPLTSLFS